MGRKSKTGGVKARNNRIQFAFYIGDKRYRPAIDVEPSQANLKRAAHRLVEIEKKIENGSFRFEDEFPDYRWIDKVTAPAEQLTFGQVADNFLASIPGDLAYSTVQGYRKILTHHWKPSFGKREFFGIKASELKTFIGSTLWDSMKTRNNVVSVGKRVFSFGYDDRPEQFNPGDKMKSLRVQRPKPDPFSLAEAESIIQGMREMYGQDDADYVEFQFFAGARPSETIAALHHNYDRPKHVLRLSGARVMGRDKKTTKTSIVRDVELNARANAVILRRIVLHKQRMLQAPVDRPITHERLFTNEKGELIKDLQRGWKRWVKVLAKLGIRYREPYQARHSSVTWNLMIGNNLLQVADNHGHSAAVMLKTYAKWMKGTDEKEIAQIRKAMEFGTRMALGTGEAT